MNSVFVVVFLALVALAKSQSSLADPFCPYYTVVLETTQVGLLNLTVTKAFQGLAADTVTLPWFNGTNNLATRNFVSNAVIAQELVDHLIAFFGFALGCNSSEFQSPNGVYAIDNVNTNMTDVHGTNATKSTHANGFQVPVSAAAFDHFNEIVVGFLHGVGVARDDQVAVSGVLAGFRNLATGATAPKVICQAADCSTSFGVAADTAGFYPSVINVVQGQSVVVTNKGENARNITTASNLAGAQACTATSSGATGATVTLGPFNTAGTFFYIDTTSCNSTATAPGSGARSGLLQVVVFSNAPPSTQPQSTTGVSPATTGTSPTTTGTSPTTTGSNPTTTGNSSAVSVILSVFAVVAACVFLMM